MAPLMESMEIHRPRANQTSTVLSYDPDILGDTAGTRADSKASKAYEWRMASDMWGCGLLWDRVNEEKGHLPFNRWPTVCCRLFKPWPLDDSDRIALRDISVQRSLALAERLRRSLSIQRIDSPRFDCELMNLACRHLLHR